MSKTSEPTANVPSERVAELRDIVAKLNRKAEKLGCPVIVMTLGEPFTSTLDDGRLVEDTPVFIDGEAPTLNGADPRLPGGAANPNAVSNRGTINLPLTNNARVFARNFNAAHNNVTGGSVGGNPPISSHWSGSTIGTFVVATPPLAITEIMYHPVASGTNDDNDFEFIELKNVGAQSLDLIGISFTNGISFTFTATNAITNLGPGQYLVLVANATTFLSRYPTVTNVAGQYT